MQSKGLQKVITARTQVVISEPFWAHLSTKLKVVEDPTARKMWTDGVHVGFNPKWAEDPDVRVDEIIARIVEMTGHVANEHHLRMTGMDQHDANKAADYALWGMLKNAGYPLPDDVFYNADFNGKSMEAIYKVIHVEPPPGEGERVDGSGFVPSDQESDDQQDMPQPGDGDGDSDQDGDEQDQPQDPGSDGEIRPLPQGVDREEHKNEWKEAILQAATAAEAAGKMPAGMRQLVDKIKNPVIPWQETLRKVVQMIIDKADYSNRRPNRRYMPQGMFLPELRSERMPAGVVYWDTSGSRDSQDARAEAAGEVMSIIDECRPEKLFVIYGDTEVTNVEIFEPGDIVKFNPIGGGGTDFRPIFEYIEKEQIEPAWFIGISDAYGTFPTSEPDYPTIWAIAGKGEVPFGERIQLS